jgi:hypothetical protein
VEGAKEETENRLFGVVELLWILGMGNNGSGYSQSVGIK